MKSLTPCLLVLLALSSALAFAQETAPAVQLPVTNTLFLLDNVVTEVLSNNPGLKAARANWEAMKERVPQMRAWEDAKLGFDSAVARFIDMPPNAMPDQRLMAEQNLPLSGRNSLSGQVAVAEALGVFAELHRRELDAVASARAAWFRLANAHVQLDLNRTNMALLKQFADLSRAKYEAGTRSQADVLSADSELAMLEETAFDLQRDISDAQTQLNVLMNRPAQSPLARPPTPGFLKISLPPDKIETMALTHRPEMIMAQNGIDAAQARLKAAQRGWIPDPDFRVEGIRYNDASQVVSEIGVGFSINLPWFNRAKYRASIKENEKLLESARHQLDSVRVETTGMVRMQLKKVETFQHHTELYTSKLLPLAQQTVASKRLGYQTDTATFLELLEAERQSQKVESTYWENLMRYQEAISELEGMVGMNPAAINLPPAGLSHEKP